MKRGPYRIAPSPYTLKVLRALLRKPMKVKEVVAATMLSEHTVRVHLRVLRKAEAVTVARVSTWPRPGSLAVYSPVLLEVRA